MRELLRTADRASGWTTALFLLAGVPLLHVAGILDMTSVNQLGRYLSFAIAAIGLDLIWGFTGVLSLCQAMFFCFGGYCIGMHMARVGPQLGENGDIPYCLYILTTEVSGFKLPWFWKPFSSLPLSLLLGVMVPGLFAAIFGFFAFRSRVKGVYFSIITQALTYAAWMVFSRNEIRLCGTNGLNRFESLAGMNLTTTFSKWALYYATLITMLAVYVVCRHIVRSRLGRLLVAVRDNESRLCFSGYQPVTIKLFAFTASAIIAAIGGMFYAPQTGIITPSDMVPLKSLFMVIWVALGGRGTLAGAVLGALLVNYSYAWLTSHFATVWPYALGALFVAVPLLLPEGIVGAWRKLIDRSSLPRVLEVLPPKIAAPAPQEAAR